MARLVLCLFLVMTIGSCLSEDTTTVIPDKPPKTSKPDPTTLPTTLPTTALPTTLPTTPTSLPTTTGKPGPKPPVEPQTGNWSVTDDTTNNVCIIFKAAVQFVVPYMHQNGTYVNQTVILPVDKSNAHGLCGNISQDISVAFNLSDKANSSASTLTLEFHRNKNETNKYYLSLVKLNIQLDNVTFPGYDQNETQVDLTSGSHLKAYNVGVNRSYSCANGDKLELTLNNNPNVTGQVSFKDLQLQAFHYGNTTQYSEAIKCPSSETDIVPIAVGCALAALVIIVLVAYLIGRRRSRARGYQSV